VPLYFLLSGISKWKELTYQKERDKNSIIMLKKIRRKYNIIPYYIILAEITLPVISILGFATVTFITEFSHIHLIINAIKLILLFFSILSTIGIVSFIITKRICKIILTNTDIDGTYPGFRIPFRTSLAMQMMLMFIVGIIVTALAGYAKLIEEKGDLILSINKKSLTRYFKPGNKYSVDQIKSLLNKVDLHDSSFSTFYLGENGDEYNSDSLPLYKDFKIYMKYLAQDYNGKIMVASGELQGTSIKIQTDRGPYWVGIKYQVVSKKMVMFFIISAVLLLILNGVIFFYFSHSISHDISTITLNLHKIAEGETVDLDKRLPVVSNDETGDLVIAFNRIQKLFKEHVTYIQNSERILREKERLASLGQLIGGIAHNMRTPIMSLAGGLEGLKKLISEYDESIDDSSVSSEDHHEIAKEMNSWIKKLGPYCSYMSDVVTTIKEHSIFSVTQDTESFTVDDLIKRINILMNNELKKNDVRLEIHANLTAQGVINGNLTILLQVMNNLILNAIEVYGDKGGTIDLFVEQIGGNIEFQVKDYGKGIPEEIQDRLFKEMVTTKGGKGTGLGLFMSVSRIISNFNGSMRFKSVEGKGTTFFVKIPFTKTGLLQDSIPFQNVIPTDVFETT
jgi:signal transduction histidine kinase